MEGYNSPLDMRTALHPQTQMTFKFGDEILPRAYGFPMKIRVPTKLGFKNPKYVVSMEVTNDYKGGYWEDRAIIPSAEANQPPFPTAIPPPGNNARQWRLAIGAGGALDLPRISISSSCPALCRVMPSFLHATLLNKTWMCRVIGERSDRRPSRRLCPAMTDRTRNFMATHKLLLLPGDGIGPEVMGEVKRLIAWINAQGIAHFTTEEGLVGGAAYDASKSKHHGRDHGAGEAQPMP